MSLRAVQLIPGLTLHTVYLGNVASLIVLYAGSPHNYFQFGFYPKQGFLFIKILKSWHKIDWRRSTNTTKLKNQL